MSLSSWPLNNPKQIVGSDSSSCMTKIPEFGPSGGGKESIEGFFWYIERGLVTYIFSLNVFAQLFLSNFWV